METELHGLSKIVNVIYLKKTEQTVDCCINFVTLIQNALKRITVIKF